MCILRDDITICNSSHETKNIIHAIKISVYFIQGVYGRIAEKLALIIMLRVFLNFTIILLFYHRMVDRIKNTS